VHTHHYGPVAIAALRHALLVVVAGMLIMVLLPAAIALQATT
jgi:hypothetical protein